MTVDVLGNMDNQPSFPDEFFQIVTSLNCSDSSCVVVGPTAVNNIPDLISLLTGTDYYLELTSGAPTDGAGTSSVNIQVTPLPGTIALFAGGLGLLGFGMRRKNKQAATRIALPN